MQVLKGKNNHAETMFYNTKIKTYADGSQQVKYNNFVSTKGNAKKEVSGVLSEEERKRQRYKNLYNAKQNVIDLAYHNSLIKEWEWFITLTFNPEEVDSKNYDQVSEKLSMFLDNLKHQNKDMRYIILPELHKSGAVHFHGIFANVPNLKTQEARNPKNNRLIYQNGTKIYNVTNYKYGFTTASEIKNQEAVSVYISKYMTKDLIDINYKKRYWSSKNLQRPTIQYAHMTEDYLKFYIDINEIENYYQNEKTISFRVLGLHNIHYAKYITF
ncbi:MAG: hypothetical protein IJY87_04635 [Bacilli bacterium]|nr:hypothetical protein [Bacilli bacterium]